MKTKFPIWFWIGLILNLSSWFISWNQIRPYSYFSFAGLWIGFILVLDGINFKLKGNSMLTRNRFGFFLTFLYSALFWWIFEILVMVTKNWYYITDRNIVSVFEHQLLGTVYFSTVIPVVFEVAEILLNKSFFSSEVRVEKVSKFVVNLYPIAGIASLLLTLWMPQYFFPLMWIFLYFFLDYINYKAGFDNLIKDILSNKWKRILSLAIAAIICGFFWEMWNSYSDPKWIYQVPLFGEFKVFEMPVLGFLGYLPFGLEVFAFFSFLQGLAKYPKEKFFELSQSSFFQNLRPVKVFFTILFALTLFIIAFGLIENDLFNKFESKSKYFVEILPDNVNKNLLISGIEGNINFCYLGIIPGKCLVTQDKKAYLLVDSLGESINIENQSVVVNGTILLAENGVGVDRIVPRNVYKLN